MEETGVDAHRTAVSGFCFALQGTASDESGVAGGNDPDGADAVIRFGRENRRERVGDMIARADAFDRMRKGCAR
jgi:hypothetical protein